MGLFDMFDPRHSDGASVQAVMDREDSNEKAAAPRAVDLVSLQYSSVGETGYPSEFTWRELVASYTSWVFTSVDKIAKTVAGAPKRLFMYKEKSSGKVLKCHEFKSILRGIEEPAERRRYLKTMANTVDRVEIPEHPLLSLLYAPNPVDTHAMFWQEIVQRLELAGSCGIYKVRGRLGVPVELWALPTSENGEFKPVPDSKLVIAGYVYDDGDVHQRFSVDDAFWLRYPNPKNKFEGMSPLKAQIFPYNIDYFLSKQQYKFYKNNAVTGKHFSTEQKMSQDELDKLWDKIDAKFGGADKAYKTIITHSGLKSEDPHNATAKDMMIDVIGKYAKDKILSGYGINEGMVGLTENQNKANLDTSRENYLTECIQPRVRMIVECFEKWLVPDFDDRIEFEVDLPEIQQRELDIVESRSNLETFKTTINEERARMKLDPVEWGDAPFVPFNLTPYGAEKPEPKPAAGVAVEEEDDDQGGGGAGAKSYKNKSVKELLWKKFDLATREAMAAFRKVSEKMFAEQKADVLSALEKLGAVVKGNIAGWNTAKVKQWISEHKEKMDKLNIDREGWEKRTKELFRPVFLDTLAKAMKARMKELSRAKAEFEVDLESDEVVEWIGTKLRKFGSDVTGTTYDEVEAVLRSGFEESKPLSNIAADIREKFDVMANYRAANIARTEAANTWNTGDLEAVRQMNLEDRLKKYWINEPGARDTHAEAGQRYDENNAIGIDEEFEVGDDVMDVPGAGALAEENCNCFLPETLFYSPSANLFFKSRFKGQVYTVETTSGNKFTCTPNHPILTLRGFFPAKFLKEGDCIFNCGGEDWVRFGSQNVKYRPASFEEVFRTSSQFFGRLRITTPGINFYGDRPQGDVDIICINSQLLDWLKSFSYQVGKDFILPYADYTKALLTFPGAQDSGGYKKTPGLISQDGMGGIGEFESLFFRGSTHSQEHGFASIPPCEPCFDESVYNSMPSDMKFIGDSFNRLPRIKKGDDFININMPSFVPTSEHCDVATMEPAVQCLQRGTLIQRYLAKFFSRPILIDKIVNIHTSPYDGFVYTANVDNNIYIADGTVAKNCRCTLGYVKI